MTEDKTIPSSITVEEAVARMVNLEYIPAESTLLDMTAARLEKAEVEHENAPLTQNVRYQTINRHAARRWRGWCRQQRPPRSSLVIDNLSYSGCD
jgi:hypothetical protein